MKREIVPDNPYDAADKWLLKENLPLSYRQQVVEFILQNSGQKDFALDTSYRDPYTGCEYWALLNSIMKIESAPCSCLFLEGIKNGYVCFLVSASAYIPGETSNLSGMNELHRKQLTRY